MRNILFLVAMLGLVACGGGDHSAPPDQGALGDDPVPGVDQGPGNGNCVPQDMLVEFSEVQMVLFEISCDQCHGTVVGGAAGVFTDQFDSVKSNLGRITAAIASGRMPSNGALSDDQKNTLAAWENIGAPLTVDSVEVCEE